MYHKEKIAIVCAHNFKSMQALSNFSIVRANMFFSNLSLTPGKSCQKKEKA